MEKYYIVKPESQLYKDYWNWRNSISKNNKLIVDFFEKNGISATRYYSSKDCLGIIPTGDDKEKFESQFTKYAKDEGLRLFKKNSKIGKAWIELTKSMNFQHRPMIAWYNRNVAGHSSSRLFDHNGVVYASLRADNIDMPDGFFEEIKGSDFHKIMEEMKDD